jgi:hypothetical protein
MVLPLPDWHGGVQAGLCPMQPERHEYAQLFAAHFEVLMQNDQQWFKLAFVTWLCYKNDIARLEWAGLEGGRPGA